MPIRLPCPHCAKPLKARPDQAGCLVRCSRCRRPLVVPAALAAPPTSRPEDTTAPPLLVLVLDPDPAVSRVTALLLTSLGYDAVEVADAAAVEVKDAGSDPAAALVDPGKHGPAAVATLRARWPQLPVVLTTSDNDSADLPKPFSRAALAVAIRNALER